MLCATANFQKLLSYQQIEFFNDPVLQVPQRDTEMDYAALSGIHHHFYD